METVNSRGVEAQIMQRDPLPSSGSGRLGTNVMGTRPSSSARSPYLSGNNSSYNDSVADI